MKNILILLVFFPVFAFSQNSNDDKNYIPEIKKTELSSYSSFYIINISGTASIKEAVQQVKNLKAKGHPSGYLWIPDFPSLSKKELYAVFIGPFNGMDSAIEYLEKYKKTDPKAYAVEASKSETRTTLFGKFDIRKNNIRQFLILTYARPKDEEDYYNNGGEDWGWFVGDVGTYFNTYYPDKVLMESVYSGWLLPKDIKALEKEMGLKQFGYVLVNGKNKKFIEHSPSDGVIRGACEFFGLEYIEEVQGD